MISRAAAFDVCLFYSLLFSPFFRIVLLQTMAHVVCTSFACELKTADTFLCPLISLQPTFAALPRALSLYL